jgi:hypothetical protein
LDPAGCARISSDEGMLSSVCCIGCHPMHISADLHAGTITPRLCYRPGRMQQISVFAVAERSIDIVRSTAAVVIVTYLRHHFERYTITTFSGNLKAQHQIEHHGRQKLSSCHCWWWRVGLIDSLAYDRVWLHRHHSVRESDTNTIAILCSVGSQQDCAR